MKKEEVFQFLQMVNYIEVLPITDCGTDLKEIVKFCKANGLLSSTPDNNYIISGKGWDLLNKRVNWDDRAFAFSQSPSKKQLVVYWGAGILTSTAIIYDIVANHLIQ